MSASGRKRTMVKENKQAGENGQKEEKKLEKTQESRLAMKEKAEMCFYFMGNWWSFF